MKAEILSWIYRREREKVIKEIFAKQDKEGRPRDFEEVFEEGDKKIRKLPKWFFNFSIPKNIGVKLHDLYFPSPLVISSFKNELDILYKWMNLGFGGVILKTAMPEDRDGNLPPRLQQVFVDGLEHLMNSMGLPGKGVEKKIAELEGSPILYMGKPIGFGLGGSSLDGYKFVFDKYHSFISTKTNIPHFYEINISCPNTAEGQQLTKHPELLEDLLLHIRSKTNAVVGAKMSPDTSGVDLLKFAELLLRFPKTYINLGNTTYRKCSDVGLPTNSLPSDGGGLSGPKLYDNTLPMARHVSITGIPIMSTGGIGTAAQVIELRKNGAVLFGMATAIGHDPYCVPIINKELAKYS